MPLLLSLKSLPNPRLPGSFPVLSSGSFIVLCFIFMSVIHFELVFAKDLKSVSKFTFLHMDF